jgi:glycosyltransferase involved in cell wall biosynthesis
LARSDPRGRILFDVSDLMSFVLESVHPTGIQRVTIDTLVALRAAAPNVVPVFFSRVFRCYCSVDADLLIAADAGYLNRVNPRSKDYSGRLRARFSILPPTKIRIEASDIVMILGVVWAARRRNRMLFGPGKPACRVIWFCHDLIPIRHPEYTAERDVLPGMFKRWLDSALSARHEFICSSRFVEADLRAYGAEQGVDARVSVVPLAHEFSAVEGPVGEKVRRLADRRIALYVSSIGLRKNQIGLVHAWERLYRELGENMPTLVLVGVNYDRGEVERYLAETGGADGKIVMTGATTDAELTALYRACEFTVFPSFCEGWGLPVGESLWMGKPCVTSNTTSMPEVGDSYVTYFDPFDEAAMAAALRNAIAGDFAALPPPRDHLRSWKQVASDIAGIVLSGPMRD